MKRLLLAATASVVALAVMGAARPAQASSFSFSTSFSSQSGAESLFGVAALNSDILKLTPAQGAQFGVYALSLGALDTYDTFTANWQSLIGGGTLSVGADGYSFNVAANLPAIPTYGDPGEEGAGSGLRVTVDTFNNGGNDGVGLSIVWQNSAVAFLPVQSDDDGSGNFLRKNAFVDASVVVTAAGVVTFTYDGNILVAVLPGYSGIQADKIMLGARTGGGNDNHWIDNLNISAADVAPTAVPEPTSMLLLGTGLAAAAYAVAETVRRIFSFQPRAAADTPSRGSFFSA